ncbi:MAG: T9SS type A sorting domain-containing protein [Ignavibacteria bacterium]
MKKILIILLILNAGICFSQNIVEKAISVGNNFQNNPEWGTDIIVYNSEPLGPITTGKLGNTLYIAINDTLATANLGIILFTSTNNGNNWTLSPYGIPFRSKIERMVFVNSGAGPDSLYLFFIYQNSIYRWNVVTNTAFQILLTGTYRTFDITGSSTGALYLFVDLLASNTIPRYASTDGGYSWPITATVTSSGAIPRVSQMVTGDTLILNYYNTSTIVGGDTTTAYIRSARYSQTANGTLTSAYFQDVATEPVPKFEYKSAMTKGVVWLMYTTGTTGNINIYGRRSTNAGQSYSSAIDVAVNPNVDEYWFDINVYQATPGGFDFIYYSDSLQSGPPTNNTDKLMYTYTPLSSSTFVTPTQISNYPPGWSLNDYKPVIVEIPLVDLGVAWVGQIGSMKGLCWDRYEYVTKIKNGNNTTIDKFSLEQNYPNPFNPITKIRFTIPNNGYVSLKVFDVLGKEIATLISSNLTAGTYSYDFDGSKLSSGTYFYSLEANGLKATRKMVLVK